MSITGVKDNKLTKCQQFESKDDANAHATEYNGFVVEDIGGKQEFWIVDKTKKTITQDTATKNSVTATREMKRIRNYRNRLLSETDWTALGDVTMSDEMKTYRQMLRDIPASNTVYEDVDWGTKP